MINKQIKPIETVYNGYRFRSRLEARWAVFFDAACIKYEYESEGFELSDGTRYLPDFYLPDYDWYVEVKPPRPGAGEELERASRFVGEKIKVLLLLGNIPPKRSIECWHYAAMYFNPLRGEVCTERCCIDVALVADQEPYHGLEITTWLGVDRAERLNVWQICGCPEVALTARHDKEMYARYAHDISGNDISSWSDTFSEDEERIKALSIPYEKARQARFEYGESGN